MSNTTLFMQFGYIEDHEATGHSVGNCPLCGKHKHFFINIDSPNKTWDCKSCGMSGGFKKFLKSIIEVATDKPSIDKVKELAVERGFEYTTLKALDVGYLHTAGVWVVPVYSEDKKDILNIKIYDGHSFRNTAGCAAAMYGLWNIPKDYDYVYVTEGEWDTIALYEMLLKVKATRSTVIGVPGAGTFKTAAANKFVGKRVYLLYDNDLSGRNGIKKAVEVLTPIAAEINKINWPKDTPDKFDVRDVYKKTYKRQAEAALDYLESICTTVEVANSVDTSEVSCQPLAVQEVYDTYNKWLHLPNTDLIDIIYGAVLSNRIPGDPVWLFVVAPPGATKTELLMSLTGATKIETISTLTPHTLISGANFGGSDPSLIPQLNGKVLIVKDFTAVLGMPSFERDEIFSILRDAYDGECAKPFGNGITRRYKSNFGILAGVTPAIEQFTDDHSSLGERFIRWYNPVSDKYEVREEFIKRALTNVSHEKEMRADINGIAKRVLLSSYNEIPKMPSHYEDQIISQAQWISVLRAKVSRDRYTKDITHRPFVELSTRICKELYKLMLGVAMFKGVKTITAEVMRLSGGIARSTIDRRYLDAIKYMYHHPTPVSTAEVKVETKLPTSTTEMVLGNLVMLNAVERELVANKARWTMTKDFRKLTETTKIFNK